MGQDETSRADRFLELLRPVERDLETYCRRMVWEQGHAEDALQNAVRRAWRAFDRYHEDASFRAWTFKILTNEIFAMNRKRGRIAAHEVPVEAEQLDALGALEQVTEYTDWLLSPDSLVEALDEDLVASLKALTETERAVLLLRAIGNFRYREIAESLDIPLGSVMGNLSRARHKMREAIFRARRRTRI